MSSTDAALAEIERAIEANPDADDVLRATVEALHQTAGYPWAGILFVEGDDLVLGPQAGTHAEPAATTSVPVTWEGDRVAELRVDDAPEEDRMFLERVVALVAGHSLVGWDTGGESWDP